MFLFVVTTAQWLERERPGRYVRERGRRRRQRAQDPRHGGGLQHHQHAEVDVPGVYGGGRSDGPGGVSLAAVAAHRERMLGASSRGPAADCGVRARRIFSY